MIIHKKNALISNKNPHSSPPGPVRSSNGQTRPAGRIPRGILICLLILVCDLLLLFTAQRSTAFANWYSDHIYFALVSSLGRFFGLFPFSMSEVLLYLLTAIILGGFLWFLWQSLHKRAHKKDWYRYLVSLLVVSVILFSLYTFCCGINYGRSSFSETADLETSPYTVEELSALCDELTAKINLLAPLMTRASDGTMMLTAPVPARARTVMLSIGESYPQLAGYYPNPKELLVPYVLSVQNLSGIYLPFTIEANYNKAMPDYNHPFTACHELSHLRGFMQEEEANFIAYLACIRSDDSEFQYSGYLLGWIYATNQLYRTDYALYEKQSAALCVSARIDIDANSAFWSQYEGPIAEVSNQINDTYLKSNGQSDGVQSYDRMVDLMISHYLGTNS